MPEDESNNRHSINFTYIECTKKETLNVLFLPVMYNLFL
jgi:hypothetical protein